REPAGRQIERALIAAARRPGAFAEHDAVGVADVLAVALLAGIEHAVAAQLVHARAGVEQAAAVAAQLAAGEVERGAVAAIEVVTVTLLAVIDDAVATHSRRTVTVTGSAVAIAGIRVGRITIA